VINTNLPPILHRFHVTVKFSVARRECLTLTLSLRVIPANIAVSDISLKTGFFGLHFCRRKYPNIFHNFGVIRAESYQIRLNFQRLQLLRRSRSFKVTGLVPIESSYTTSYLTPSPRYSLGNVCEVLDFESPLQRLISQITCPLQ